ncbi:hypothetical protein HK101_008903 [Irineochytrium annulatum]|nr:hypothetical protein HK101_008903 [Irineochytrium annulatum]
MPGNALTEKATNLQLKNAQLEEQIETLKSEHAETRKALDVARELGSPEAQKKYHDMELQMASIKEEQAELYKTQGQNAQRLLEMVETTKSQETTLKKQSEEINRLNALISSLTIKLQDSQELIKEKDGVIQIVRDELATHQLEIVQREEQLKESEARVKALEAENNQLVERWILLKQGEAQKMNEVNEFVET